MSITNFGQIGTAQVQFPNGTDVLVPGRITVNALPHATGDTDKFLVSDNGEFKYRTGSEVLSDIGGGGSGGDVTGTVGMIAMFVPDTTSVGNSIMFQNGLNVGVANANPVGKIDTSGLIYSTGPYSGLNLKYPTMSHGLTTILPTDVYFGIKGSGESESTSDIGGSVISGVSKRNGCGSSLPGLTFLGVQGDTDPYDDIEGIKLISGKSNGSGNWAALGSEETVLTINNYISPVVKIRGDGRVSVPNLGAGTVMSDATGTLFVSSSSDIPWTDYSNDATVEGWGSFVTRSIFYSRTNGTIFGNFYIEGVQNVTDAFFTFPFISKSTKLAFCSGASFNSVDGTKSLGNITVQKESTTGVWVSFGPTYNSWPVGSTKIATGSFWFIPTV